MRVSHACRSASAWLHSLAQLGLSSLSVSFVLGLKLAVQLGAALAPPAMTAYTPLPTTTTSSSTSQQSSSSSSRFNLPLPWRYPPSNCTAPSAGFDQPTLFQAITARPLRLLAWAAALILALLIVSGSFGKGPATSHVAKIGSYASENFWATKKGSSEWRELPQNQDLLDPVMQKDSRTGFLMPPDVYPAAMNP